MKERICEYLQGIGHSIDVLLALYAMCLSEGMLSWRDMKEWAKQRGVTLSDGTFRKRRDELVELGLAEKEVIDPLKFSVKLTSKGVKVAEIIEEALEKLKALENTETAK